MFDRNIFMEKLCIQSVLLSRVITYASGYEASFRKLPSVMRQLSHDVGNKQSDFIYMKPKIQFEAITTIYTAIIIL